MEQYREIKQQDSVADVTNEGYPFLAYDGSDVITITHYLVQVRGLFLWHTIKVFKKILPAARLLKHLRNLKEE